MPSQEAEPHVFVLFGATGDLARRKLLPAVHRLSREGALRRGFHVLGVARDRGLGDDGFRALAREALQEAGIEDFSAWCDHCLHFQAVGGEGDYAALARRLESIESDGFIPGNRVFYLAVPPGAFAGIVRGLGESGLAESKGYARLVLEKPFGRDLEDARTLNELVHRWFDESQVYRIDHFLGKETVQNLLVFRFANALFESLWSRNHVDSVQITVAEDAGIAGREGYYDKVGALRDMVQNHLTQILTLVAMEVPATYDADSIRTEKTKVLRSTKPLERERVVFGRYAAGKAGGAPVPGYLEEEGTPRDSRTETYVALRASIDNWRWQGVPFYLRTGKRMERRSTEVAVVFRRPPVALFRSMELGEVPQDVLRMTLQPDEGFSLHVDVKRPGSPASLAKVPLEFRYASAFGAMADAYVTLLLDVLEGDQTLFVHAEEAELAWKLYQPLLDGETPVHEYAAGSWGPQEADRLLERDGRAWRNER